MDPETQSPTAARVGPLRRLYNWVLGWAESPYGTWALFLLAVAEASFFPIPPDVLLIALCVGKPKRSFFYAAVCGVGSVLGGLLGYWIGWRLFSSVAWPIIEIYHAQGYYDAVRQAYADNAFLAVLTAAFTPIPYKVFTIAAGACEISLPVFLAASAVGRTARFTVVAGLIFAFGPGIQRFIDRYFNLLTILFLVLLVLGFAILKWVV